MVDDRILDVDALAPILCLSPRTLRNKLCADPASLPPRVRVPGVRGPRWRWSDVQAWLGSLPLLIEPTAEVAPRTRPGRRRRAV